MGFQEWTEKTKVGQAVGGVIAGLIILVFIGIMYAVLGPGMAWIEHFYRDVLHLGALVDWFQNLWLR